MTYVTHNQENISANGTCLQGYCADSVTYHDLVRVFGPPTDGDGYKVDAEWIIEFDTGEVATIYNYKTGPNYLGGAAYDVESMRGKFWHIGGHSKAVVDMVNETIKGQ